jgi:ABC-type multidrug transport system ATPase subunit
LISFDGETFKRARVDLRRRLFYLPDFPVVFPDVTVLEHIAMMLRFYEQERDNVEDEVLELLELFEILPYANARFPTLSRGQAQAALIAMCLVRPELWLLDEPMASGMDSNGLRAFKAKARQAAENGATVLYTTQLPEVAEPFSDGLIVLHRGELIAFSSAAELREKHKGIPLEEVLAGLQKAE